MKISHKGLLLLQHFLKSRLTEISGAEASRELKISSGTMYPLLSRFEKAGWLNSRWEKIDPSQEGRPRRRFYQITALGIREANSLLENFGMATRLAEAEQPVGVPIENKEIV